MQIFPDVMSAVAQSSAKAQDTGSTSGASSSSANTATVTANDFLQLLVAEMKNQDPTANTDPTQYIDQLVQVNSLEQLVQINQDLGGGSSDSTVPSAHAIDSDGSAANLTGPAGNLSPMTPGPAASAATRVASALGRSANPTNPVVTNGSGTTSANPFDAITAMRKGAHAASTTTNSPAR